MKYLIYILLLMLWSSAAFAQVTDSLGRKVTELPAPPLSKADDTMRVARMKVRKPMSRPLRAALLSAVIPGAGQYYNKSLWYIRVPVIYGAALALGLTIKYNHDNYILYRDTYLYRLDKNPLTIPPPDFGTFTNDALVARRDNFRRDRDFFTILTAAIYALNIAEAATTAHLKKFDVSDDLSLRITPRIFAPQGWASQGGALGLSFHFTLKSNP